MPATKVLIIDDDQRLNQLLRDYLQDFDFEVRGALLPGQGKKLLATWKPEVLVVDVMMPEQDGFSLCKEIRTTSNIPIVMLTARGEATDRVLGLEIGADDYLPKPFEPRELVARIRAVLRRSSASPNQLHLSIKLDQSSQRVQLEDGRWIPLHFKEVHLLELLIAAAPGIASRDQLALQLYGRELGVDDRSIDVLVSRLRRKLGDNPRQPHIIASVRSSGYRLLGKQ